VAKRASKATKEIVTHPKVRRGVEHRQRHDGDRHASVYAMPTPKICGLDERWRVAELAWE
jgi:hypothetical protein